MKATFENSVNVLVNAYMNDTLIHGNCDSCAVGELIKSSGYKKGYIYEWAYAVPDKVSYQPNHRLFNEGLNQIKSSGYTGIDLYRVERAFEGWGQEWGLNPSKDVFDSLLRVVDVLAEIHGIDLKAKEEAKLLFVKA